MVHVTEQARSILFYNLPGQFCGAVQGLVSAASPVQLLPFGATGLA